MFFIRAGRFRRVFPAVLLVFCVFLFGCAPLETGSGSSAVLPAVETSGTFKVHEYALIEASTDNPGHVEFQDRAAAAVTAQHSVWLFGGSQDNMLAPNQAMAPFGYRLVANPTPPYSGFALYHDNQLIQRDIAHFWPVSIKKMDNASKNGDFVFTFETMNGDKLVADTSGIHPYPGQDQSASTMMNNVLIKNQVAYTNSVISDVRMDASIQPLYVDFANTTTFGRQMVAGQPFYFYLNGDLVRLNYAGHDLAYTYDQVIHDKTGAIAIFNPGSIGRVGWFYALRDGLWYYVEIGVFG